MTLGQSLTPYRPRGLVVAGCSRRKRQTAGPVPALELYEGWCIPLLRRRVAGDPAARRRVLILSAEHGIIDADTPLLPYNRLMTAQRAAELHETACAKLTERIHAVGADELLLLLTDRYLQALAGLLGQPSPAWRWIPDPVSDWDVVESTLAAWGWPDPNPCRSQS